MDPPINRNRCSKVAILGTHPPRRCGIATFTTDLAAAVRLAAPDAQVGVIAMSDEQYDYPPDVFAQIPVCDHKAYSLAAEALNRSEVEVLSIQHEYGIFGGTCGSYLIDLLRKVNRPVVTTLHTILRCPSDDQREILDQIIELSTRLVVMSRTAQDLLSEIHGVNPDKVDCIHHGIPVIPPGAGQALRGEMDSNGPILLTFGLLSPDKGIENVILSLPRLAADHPGVRYLIVGATHPHVKATAGESYRQSLIALADELGVAQHVEFVDEFVPLEKLIEYLSATDFYITPYLNPMQITSGTLAYSMGAGKVVISTPYEYAKEVLADGRGVLVPFRDPQAIAEAVLRCCAKPEQQVEIADRALGYGAQMHWEQVGQLYFKSFQQAIQEYTPKLAVSVIDPECGCLRSEPSLSHLETLTDDTGILQHATFTTANRSEGYCVDDNARALIFTLLRESRDGPNEKLERLQSRYLSFVADSFNEETGRFRNFMNFQRHWLEEAGSEDSQGRTIWALGETSKRCPCSERAVFASKLFLSAIEPLNQSRSPRTWAYLILGSAALLQSQPNQKSALCLLETMAGRLHDLFQRNACLDWMWIEPRLAYANARIPQAMIQAGYMLNNGKMLADGLASLKWLLARQTTKDGDFAPVGSHGAGPSDFGTIQFDQQPIEAASTVSACLTAYEVSGQSQFLAEATRCFEWFLGRNVLGLTLVNPEYGGCYDGLLRSGVNRNQGAESTLAYLTASTELRIAIEGSKNQQKLGNT